MAVVLAASGLSIGAEPSDVWLLFSEARVDSSGVFLDQLVQPVQPVVLPHIRLAQAPPLGQAVILSRQQILAIVQTNDPSLVVTNWMGARQVHILRRTRQLDEIEMLRLLTTVLQRDEVKTRGELELHLTLKWTPVTVPDEPLTIKIGEFPANGLSANCLVGTELWSGQEHVGTWQLGMHARIWHDVAVARTPIVRGQLLKDADVMSQRMDVLLLRDVLQDVASADPSLELTENIPAGSPLPIRALRMRPLIHRGRLVNGIFRDGNLAISLKVETLEDGALGQTVRVRNPKTRRELFGKVENEETVDIAL